MNYWLLKSEPNEFSWTDLMACPQRTEMWSGVRNHQAKNNMIAMKKGDRAFFYHSVKDREIVGICEVAKESYPDPTVKPEKLKKDGSNPWVVVDVKAVEPVEPPVSLDRIKREPALSEMVLVNNSRLSVQPVKPAEWRKICKIAGLTQE